MKSEFKPADFFRGPQEYITAERKLSEKQIEKKSVKWARDHGWFSRKYKAPGQMGVQDRIFIKNGRVVFVEYKRIGNEPTDLQCDDAYQVHKAGGEVYWTNTIAGTQWILGSK